MKIDLKNYPANTLENKALIECIQRAWDTLGEINQYPVYGFSKRDNINPLDIVVVMPTPFQYDLDVFIGYVVQIRKNAGSFGSDKILFRTSNGNLMTWENQSFLILPPSEVLLIKDIFQELINDEKEYIKEDGTYTIEGKDPKKGFIVS